MFPDELSPILPQMETVPGEMSARATKQRPLEAYGGSLVSKAHNCDYVHMIVLVYTSSWLTQLTAYLRQKHVVLIISP